MQQFAQNTAQSQAYHQSQQYAQRPTMSAAQQQQYHAIARQHPQAQHYSEAQMMAMPGPTPQPAQSRYQPAHLYAGQQLQHGQTAVGEQNGIGTMSRLVSEQPTISDLRQTSSSPALFTSVPLAPVPTYNNLQQVRSSDDNEDRLILHAYIYDYLYKNGLGDTAWAFLLECPDTPVVTKSAGKVGDKVMAASREGDTVNSRNNGGKSHSIVSSPGSSSGQNSPLKTESGSPIKGSASAENAGERFQAGGGSDNASTNSSDISSIVSHFGFSNGNMENDVSPATLPSPTVADQDRTRQNSSNVFQGHSRTELPEPMVDFKQERGFLHAWWTVHWDMMMALRFRRGTQAARNYLESRAESGPPQNIAAQRQHAEQQAAYNQQMQQMRAPQVSAAGQQHQQPSNAHTPADLAMMQAHGGMSPEQAAYLRNQAMMAQQRRATLPPQQPGLQAPPMQQQRQASLPGQYAQGQVQNPQLVHALVQQQNQKMQQQQQQAYQMAAAQQQRAHSAQLSMGPGQPPRPISAASRTIPVDHQPEMRYHMNGMTQEQLHQMHAEGQRRAMSPQTVPASPRKQVRGIEQGPPMASPSGHLQLSAADMAAMQRQAQMQGLRVPSQAENAMLQQQQQQLNPQASQSLEAYRQQMSMNQQLQMQMQQGRAGPAAVRPTQASPAMRPTNGVAGFPQHGLISPALRPDQADFSAQQAARAQQTNQQMTQQQYTQQQAMRAFSQARPPPNDQTVQANGNRQATYRMQPNAAPTPPPETPQSVQHLSPISTPRTPAMRGEKGRKRPAEVSAQDGPKKRANQNVGPEQTVVQPKQTATQDTPVPSKIGSSEFNLNHSLPPNFDLAQFGGEQLGASQSNDMWDMFIDPKEFSLAGGDDASGGLSL